MMTTSPTARCVPAGHYKWLVLAVAVIAQATAALATQGIGVLAGFVQLDLHLSSTEVGILASVLNTAPILCLVIVGQWLDRTSIRAVIGVGTLVMGLAMTAMLWVDTFPVLLACLFLVGAGYSTAQPGGSKAVFHWFAARERGLAMGIRQAGLPLGGAMAAAIFPGIAHTLGWRVAFAVGAGVIAAGGLVFCIAYRDPAQRIGQGAGSAPMRQRGSLRALAGVPEFRRASLSGVALVAVQTVVLLFLILFLHDRFHVTLLAGASYLLIMELAGAAGRVLLATWSDHVRQGRSGIVMVAVIGSLLGLVGLGIYPPDAGRWALVIIVAWLGFFCFGWYGPWVAWVSEVGPDDHVGSTLGLAMSVNQVAVVVAPTFFGALADLTGSYSIAGMVLVLALLGYAVYARMPCAAA